MNETVKAVLDSKFEIIKDLSITSEGYGTTNF